jgi:hypothetical protein
MRRLDPVWQEMVPAGLARHVGFSDEWHVVHLKDRSVEGMRADLKECCPWMHVLEIDSAIDELCKYAREQGVHIEGDPIPAYPGKLVTDRP